MIALKHAGRFGESDTFACSSPRNISTVPRQAKPDIESTTSGCAMARTDSDALKCSSLSATARKSNQLRLEGKRGSPSLARVRTADRKLKCSASIVEEKELG